MLAVKKANLCGSGRRLSHLEEDLPADDSSHVAESNFEIDQECPLGVPCFLTPCPAAAGSSA